MSKIKLLLLSAGLSSNGIDMFVFNVIKNIDMKKYDVTILIAIDKDMECINERETVATGAKVIHACDLDTIEKKKQYFRFVRQNMESGGYDVVHANMDLLNGILLSYAKKAGIKTRICHAHNSHSQLTGAGFRGKITNMAQAAYRFVMKQMILHNSTELVGCSESANKHFFGKSSDKALVIYNGIDLSKFSMPTDFCASDYKKDGIMPDKINFVTVGRISYPKNPEMIVDIVSELSKLRTDFCLNWIGNGELFEKTKELAEKNGVLQYINFMGVRSDVNKILNCCEWFLMPSRFEGLPFALVEAQASGLTCFISDTIPLMSNFGGCKVISLSSGAENWAKEINAMISSGTRLHADDRIKKFDISYTMSQLDEIYSKNI